MCPARTALWLCVHVGVYVCPPSRSECVQETKGFRLSHHLLRQLTPLSVPDAEPAQSAVMLVVWTGSLRC